MLLYSTSLPGYLWWCGLYSIILPRQLATTNILMHRLAGITQHFDELSGWLIQQDCLLFSGAVLYTYSGTSLIRTSIIPAPPLSGQPKLVMWLLVY